MSDFSVTCEHEYFLGFVAGHVVFLEVVHESVRVASFSVVEFRGYGGLSSFIELAMLAGSVKLSVQSREKILNIPPLCFAPLGGESEGGFILFFFSLSEIPSEVCGFPRNSAEFCGCCISAVCAVIVAGFGISTAFSAMSVISSGTAIRFFARLHISMYLCCIA